jgi:hypothetical protein
MQLAEPILRERRTDDGDVLITHVLPDPPIRRLVEIKKKAGRQGGIRLV